MSRSGLLHWRIVSLGAAIVAILIGGASFALSRASAEPHGSREAAAARTKVRGAHEARQAAAAAPVSVLSVSPVEHSTGVNGASPIRVVFSAPLAADSPLPSVSPSIPGSWQRISPTTVEFLPRQGFPEQTHVRVMIPGGPAGVRSAKGGLARARVVDRFWTGSYSTVRLEQLLAQLDYLPLTWLSLPGNTPVSPADANAQLSAAYSPPQGTFSWQAGYPAQLQSLWQPGQQGVILTGAVMAFEAQHGMTMDGSAGPQVWKALLAAVARGDNNPNGYTYALASKANPETLTIWHDGHVVLHSLANTGIPERPTVDGTFPVYLKYTFQIMKGTNPDGSKYADPVSWVSYFNGGDAVHYFPRGSYGWPQSLGCVELPYGQAEASYPYLTYGSLVTVAG